MDVKSLAEYLDQMEMFPYFTLCHIIVSTLNVRADLGSGKSLCTIFNVELVSTN